jgi:hypothetical protein
MAKTISRTDSKSGRFYTVDGEKLPSVTSVLGCIAKPALIAWAAGEERKAVIHAATTLYEGLRTNGVTVPASMFRSSLDAELGAAKAHIKVMEAAGEIGTQVHARIEWYLRVLLGQKVGDAPFLSESAQIAYEAWEDWTNSVELRPVHVEKTVYSLTHRYAGTMDLLAYVNDTLTLVDWKTGKSIYPEAFVQNAAYQVAVREMGLGDVRAGLIVRLPKTLDDPAFETQSAPAADDLFPVFRAALQVWAWCYENEKAYQQRKRKVA